MAPSLAKMQQSAAAPCKTTALRPWAAPMSTLRHYYGAAATASPALVGGAAQQMVRRCPSAVCRSKRATAEDEKEIEAMKLAASKGDLLEGGVQDVLFKVVIVAVSVALVVFLATLGKPIIDNTLASFPTAASPRA